MKYVKKYFEALEELEKYYVFPKRHMELMKIIPLVKNGVFLIYGPYGYGKTLYAKLVSKVMFDLNEIAWFTLNSDLTIYDVFYQLDIGKLSKGVEDVEPRKIVKSPFKFLNEIQRGNSRIYNMLLPLISEKNLIYRDFKFGTPDFLMFMDANPFDSASVEIPRALLDRITASFTILTPEEEDRMRLMPMDNNNILKRVKNVLNYENMKKIWDEVDSILFPEDLKFLLTVLIHNYLNNCVRGNKEYQNPNHMEEHCKFCRWEHEPCSEITEPLGQRWWIDVIKLSKARAYFNQRNEVLLDDLWFSIPYVLPHRVSLRPDISIHDHKEEWSMNLVYRIKNELSARWIPALKGNKKALADSRRTLNFLWESGTYGN